MEFAGPRAGRNVRTAVVHRSEQRAVCSGRVLMLRLHGGHGNVTLVSGLQLLTSWTSRGATGTTVEAHAVDRRVVVDHGCVVGVAHDGDVDVGHRAVVVVSATLPVTAEEAGAGVAESVVDSAIEANFRSPVAVVPNVEAVIPVPEARSPEQANFRRKDPRAWNPEVAIGTVGPIAGGPDVAGSWADWLDIHGQYRRTNPNRDAHSNLCSGWNRYRQ